MKTVFHKHVYISKYKFFNLIAHYKNKHEQWWCFDIRIQTLNALRYYKNVWKGKENWPIVWVVMSSSCRVVSLSNSFVMVGVAKPKIMYSPKFNYCSILKQTNYTWDNWHMPLCYTRYNKKEKTCTTREWKLRNQQNVQRYPINIFHLVRFLSEKERYCIFRLSLQTIT